MPRKKQRPKTMAQGAPCVTAAALYQLDPGPDEHLVLDLARQFQREEDPYYCGGVVSWANQERAMRLVNALGFCEVLKLLK